MPPPYTCHHSSYAVLWSSWLNCYPNSYNFFLFFLPLLFIVASFNHVLLSYGFSSSHAWMWELDDKEGWAIKARKPRQILFLTQVWWWVEGKPLGKKPEGKTGEHVFSSCLKIRIRHFVVWREAGKRERDQRHKGRMEFRRRLSKAQLEY